MKEVIWEKINESGNGNYQTFYARIDEGFFIKNVEKISENKSQEETQFFHIEKRSCEWEFEEL